MSDEEWDNHIARIQSNLNRAEERLGNAERNMRQTVWMWKYLLLPMWVFLVIVWTIRALR